MSGFERAVVAAAVGTATRPVDPATLPAELRPAAADGRGPAATVLEAGALHAVAARACAGLVDGAVATPDLAPETRWLPGRTWLAALRQAVGTRAGEVVAEALVALAAAGGRVPAELVPDLLAMPVPQEARGRVPLDVLGVRGRWLLGLEPHGPWALGAPATDGAEVWEAGTTAERAAWLGQVHRSDPARARALLDDAWPREDRAAREAMLRAVGDSLGPGDDAVLERALDDRVADVRALARALAARLPGSAYAQRMTRRAEAAVERRLLGRSRLVSARIAPDGRDGVPDPAADPAAALAAVAAAVPLDRWPGLLGRPAHELVGRPVADGHLTLDEGLALAAVRERDVAVADAFARQLAHDLAGPQPATPGPTRVRAAALASPRARAEAFVAALAARSPVALGLLAHEVWPPDLADVALHAAGTPAWRSNLPAVLRLLLAHGDVTGPIDLAGRVRGLLSADDFPANLRGPAYAAAATLDLRRTLALELKEPR